MFVLKKSIQSELNKAQEKGFKEGVSHANNINDLSVMQIKKEYDTKILQLKSDLHISKYKYNRVEKAIIEANEKDRLADQKIIMAQNIVLRVQQVLNNIGDTAVRGKADIESIRKEIVDDTEKIIDKGE